MTGNPFGFSVYTAANAQSRVPARNKGRYPRTAHSKLEVAENAAFAEFGTKSHECGHQGILVTGSAEGSPVYMTADTQGSIQPTTVERLPSSSLAKNAPRSNGHHRTNTALYGGSTSE